MVYKTHTNLFFSQIHLNITKSSVSPKVFYLLLFFTSGGRSLYKIPVRGESHTPVSMSTRHG